MPKRFSERILEFLQDPAYQPMKARKLARALGIAEAEYGDFHESVDALRRVGRVVLGTNNAVMLPYPAGHVVGTYRANPRGFGFLVPDEPTAHGDLYIAAGNSLDAVTGDKVLCQIIKRGRPGSKREFGGRITQVIERGESRFVGQLLKESDICYVKPDGNMLHAPILIGDPKASGAKPGDQVVVEITRYPRSGSAAKGVIVERLGRCGKPGVDVQTIMRQYHLPDAFPAEVLEQCRELVRGFDPEAEAAVREDLSDLTVITIDPDEARDFDDAISLRKLSSRSAGTQKKTSKKKTGKKKAAAGPVAWELGVHIADVSTFVSSGSPLDVEARKRGTSVYLPGQVIPMLPEVLSNGLCSLQEGEPRLCKSVFIQYDRRGNVLSSRFANTLIRSACRLTYRQATAILDGKRVRCPKAAFDLVKLMDKLARAIQTRRVSDGMIVLDLPAVDLVLDDHGRVTDAKPEDTSFSHTIIEMFMVEANEAAARLMHAKRTPCLRRIHPKPDEEALEAMARFVQAGGMKLPNKITPADLQQLLAKLRGRPEGYAVNLAVLRSMQMAEYSPKAIGHFALASDHYAHFTSPIRRYPDLMLHRLLDLHMSGSLSKKKKKKKTRKRTPGLIPDEVLHGEGRELSYLSRRAESAERELKTLKVLTLLQEHVGDTFEGVVTGVTNFGMFVQHPKYLVDGLLRVEDLGDDWWDIDVATGRVVGERSRTTFTLGSRLKVTIADVDISSRQLNLGLAEARSRAKGRRGAKPRSQEKPVRKKGSRPRPSRSRPRKKTRRRR